MPPGRVGDRHTGPAPAGSDPVGRSPPCAAGARPRRGSARAGTAATAGCGCPGGEESRDQVVAQILPRAAVDDPTEQVGVGAAVGEGRARLGEEWGGQDVLCHVTRVVGVRVVPPVCEGLGHREGVTADVGQPVSLRRCAPSCVHVDTVHPKVLLAHSPDRGHQSLVDRRTCAHHPRMPGDQASISPCPGRVPLRGSVHGTPGARCGSTQGHSPGGMRPGRPATPSWRRTVAAGTSTATGCRRSRRRGRWTATSWPGPGSRASTPLGGSAGATTDPAVGAVRGHPVAAGRADRQPRPALRRGAGGGPGGLRGHRAGGDPRPVVHPWIRPVPGARCADGRVREADEPVWDEGRVARSR